MSDEEKRNWIKVKEHLEAEGKTDCFFYKRACAIAADKPDPLKSLK